MTLQTKCGLDILSNALLLAALSLHCAMSSDISPKETPHGHGNVACWTDGLTWEQCCNVLFGPLGNSICWDADGHNSETCCQGDFFEAANCKEFVATFDFTVVKLIPQAWEECATKMQHEPERCNSVQTTSQLCPECSAMSKHVAKYIGCVKSEQVKASGASGDDSARTKAAIAGQHYPTVFVPLSEGRDFAVVAPAFDCYVGNSLKADGRWMHTEVQLLVGLTRPGDVFVDAGANIGGFTLPMAKHVGLDGQVHAFEPFRLMFQNLNANVMFNGLANVHTYQVALGNQSAIVKRSQPNLNAIMNPSKMHVAQTVASDLMVRRDTKLTESVFVEMLDSYFAGDGIGLIGRQHRGPSFIKIDVESMELPLVQGALKTLRRFRPSLYIEDSGFMGSGASPSRLMQLLYMEGYLWIDLVKSGFRDATSLLFVPYERKQEMTERLHAIDWDWKGGH